MKMKIKMNKKIYTNNMYDTLLALALWYMIVFINFYYLYISLISQCLNYLMYILEIVIISKLQRIYFTILYRVINYLCLEISNK